MKIHILCKEPYPNGYAATNRINCYAQAMSMAGFDTTVVVLTRTEEKGVERGNHLKQGAFGNHRFLYLRETQRPKNKILRGLDKLSEDFYIKKYIKSEIKEGDLVLLYLREMPICEYIVKTLSDRKIKVIRDLCEYPYRIDNDENKKRAQDYLKNILPLYGGVIAISEPLFELANQYMTPQSVIVKIPILVNMERKGMDVCPKKMESDYIFHSGSLYENKDGILGILKAVKAINEETTHKLLFISSGRLESSPDFELYNNFINDNSLQHLVQFVGFLSDEDMLAYQKGATALVINKLDNLQNRNCFPTKLAEYLLSETPVIISDIGESKLFLNNTQDAYIFKNGDYLELKTSILKCINNKEAAKQMGIAGSLTAKKHFTYESQIDKIRIYINELLK